MTRPLVWKLLLALSVGANVALGAFVVLREPGTEVAASAADGDELSCLLATLDLDPTQQAAIDRVRAGFESAHEDRHAAMRAARLELFRLIEQSPEERTAIEQHLGHVGSAQLAIRRDVVDRILGIAAVLRPDQRARFLAGLRERFVEGPHHREREGATGACPRTTTAGGGTEGQAP